MTTEHTASAEPVPTPHASAAEPRRRRGFLLFLRDVLVIVLIAVLVSFLVKTFLIRSFYIPSGSMEDTLLVNDRILVDEITPRFTGYDRGEIVVFRDPGGWLPPSASESRPALVEAVDWLLALVGLSAPDSDDHLVKRLIGLPGDHVICCNAIGQITVNDVPIDETDYLKLPTGETAASGDPFDVIVPDGQPLGARRQPLPLQGLAVQPGSAGQGLRAGRERGRAGIPHHVAARPLRGPRLPRRGVRGRSRRRAARRTARDTPSGRTPGRDGHRAAPHTRASSAQGAAARDRVRRSRAAVRWPARSPSARWSSPRPRPASGSRRVSATPSSFPSPGARMSPAARRGGWSRAPSDGRATTRSTRSASCALSASPRSVRSPISAPTASCPRTPSCCSTATTTTSRPRARGVCVVRPVIKADRDCASAAAASVIAKVARDALMTGLHDELPAYCWASNKGYASPEHRDAIREHGISRHHRASWSITDAPTLF